MEERQLWNYDRATTTTTSDITHCTPFTLPSNAILSLGPLQVITLSEDAILRPECTGTSDVILSGAGSPTSFTDFRDPFYASTLPQCYALAATTVIAYMLVIMLLITPRTFLHEGALVLGRRGFTNGPSGSDAGIGIGGRPWLQKVAAATVAISLTIATADTFAVAEKQYVRGYMDASELQNEVGDGLELKVIRIISDTFLWLAQAQTMIRLFPRQTEKIIIKWTAFALISLDVLFSILNNFLFNGNSRPRSFVDAVPALTYLFQLALSLLYCAWIIYYAIMKKRFAFYHKQMWNQCLVALLSLVSVLIPVVFFVLDISKRNVAGWGDYVRWVGAAAASVVVWEWVERIEALERNDKKDGVLGREVFDGDEMLEVSPASNCGQNGKDHSRDGGGGNGTATGNNGRSWPGVAGIASRYIPRASHDIESATAEAVGASQYAAKRAPRPRPPLWPTQPPTAATPVSRTDTASAESTVYAIRYHPISEATPSVRENRVPPLPPSMRNSMDITNDRTTNEDINEDGDRPVIVERMELQEHSSNALRPNAWQTLSKANPFGKRVQAPPPEISAYALKAKEPIDTHQTFHRWDVRAKLEDFAATQADKLREKTRPKDNTSELTVTVIPAPTRRRNLDDALEEPETPESAERLELPQRTIIASDAITLNRPSVQNEAELTRSLRPRRLSDPYKTEDLNGQPLHQRRAISFVTPAPQDPSQEQPTKPVSPIHGPRDRTTPVNVISSCHIPAQLKSSASAISPGLSRTDGLPVMSIPAPPRKSRSDSE